MGKTFVDTRIEYIKTHPLDAVTRSESYFRDFARHNSKSMFTMFERLSDPTLPRCYDNTLTDDAMWSKYCSVIFPIMKQEILSVAKTQQQADELRDKKAKAARAQLDTLRDESLPQLQIIDTINNTFNNYVSKDTLPLIKYVGHELLNKDDSDLMEAFTHGRILSYSNKPVQNIFINECVKREIAEYKDLAQQYGPEQALEAWKQQSDMVHFVNTLKALGTSNKFVNDFVQAGNLTQSPSNKDYINNYTNRLYNEILTDSTFVLHDADCATVELEGKKYNLYNPKQYEEYKETMDDNSEVARSAMQCVELEVSMNREQQK